MSYDFDIESIREQFNKVISYSQGISNPKTEELFERFLEAKKDLINFFHGHLIYEWPEKVSFSLDDKTKEHRLEEFLETINYTYNNEDLKDFISVNKEGFFDNTVIDTYFYKDKKIPRGMKLVKAFKYFEENPRSLEDIQNYASRIIQEDKIEGTLCFSVHPLDFLSVSENTYNWRSCHALDGEYRAGNLSYMVDKSTFICYLRGADNQKLPHFPEDVLWNSKKWRMLLYMEDERRGLMAGRQYPFMTTNALIQIRDIINTFDKSFQLREWVDGGINSIPNKMGVSPMGNEETIGLAETWIPILSRLYPISDIVEDAGYNTLQYNDLLYSSCYLPIYSLKLYYYPREGDLPHWSIGGDVPCLQCGKTMIENGEYMRCGDCEFSYGVNEDDNYGYCSCCGSRIILDEANSVGDENELVCDSCADIYCKRCECCNNLYYTQDIHYHKGTDMYLCPWCFRDAGEEKVDNFKSLKDFARNFM